jgi:hypothetical protein
MKVATEIMVVGEKIEERMGFCLKFRVGLAARVARRPSN